MASASPHNSSQPQPSSQDESAGVRRILVIRSQGLRDRVGAAIAGAGVHAQVISAPSFLSAMGELRSARPDVIIGPVSAMTGMVASTGKALRKLAPEARLVAVAHNEERGEAATAVSAGFDDCVFEPADATNLLGAMGLARRERRGEVHAADQVEQATEQAAVPVVSVTEHSLPTDDVRVAGHAPPPLPGQDLGDVDLVEAVLRGDGTLQGLALRLMRQQSEMDSADWVAAAGEVPAGHASIVLEYAGTSVGVLHAPQPTTVGQLEPWAAWLSRWMVLGRRMFDLHKLAMTDELTGVWNRRYFRRFLNRLIARAAEGRQQVTLLLFDIDDFKVYNDRYGHPAGDEILRETAKLIQSLVREHDVVARIGGDEFAVVFWDKGEPRHPGSQHPDNVIKIAKRFQKAICEHRYPKLGTEATGRLTVSGGLASFPWDGRTPDELIARADLMAIQSKRQGKNVICFGPGAAPRGSGE